MLRRFLRAMLALSLPALLWLWAASKWMLDWVGRGSAMADLLNSDGLTAQAARWVFATPPWVPAILATIGTAWWAWLVSHWLKPSMPTVTYGDAAVPVREPASDDGKAREGRAVLGSPALYSSGERRFLLRFSKRDAQSVYLNKGGTNLDWIASVRGLTRGSTVDLTLLHLKSEYRELVVGELFLARNAAGYVMQGRLKDVRTREIDGPGEDMAIFDYKIAPGQSSVVVAM